MMINLKDLHSRLKLVVVIVHRSLCWCYTDYCFCLFRALWWAFSHSNDTFRNILWNWCIYYILYYPWIWACTFLRESQSIWTHILAWLSVLGTATMGETQYVGWLSGIFSVIPWFSRSWIALSTFFLNMERIFLCGCEIGNTHSSIFNWCFCPFSLPIPWKTEALLIWIRDKRESCCPREFSWRFIRPSSCAAICSDNKHLLFLSSPT